MRINLVSHIFLNESTLKYFKISGTYLNITGVFPKEKIRNKISRLLISWQDRKIGRKQKNKFGVNQET